MRTIETLNPDADGVMVWNQVGGNGWQHPWIHNARYAVLIGGGDTDSSKNYDAFKNDLKAMYDKLKGYSYLDENIYSFFWDKTDSYAYWVDGPATWSTTNEENSMIAQKIKEIGGKITKNDFFTFVEICHGAGETYEDGTKGSVIRVLDGDRWANGVTVGLNLAIDNPDKSIIDLNYYLDPYIGNKPARAVFVMGSCGNGYALPLLCGENRVVITASSVYNYEHPKAYDESGLPKDVFTEMNSNSGHWAFIYEGNDKDWLTGDHPHDGFVRSLGGISSANNILHAFNNGYIAASNNRYAHPLNPVDATSHPMLEDNPNNGVTGTQGSLNPQSMSDEGWLAKYTYW